MLKPFDGVPRPAGLTSIVYRPAGTTPVTWAAHSGPRLVDPAGTTAVGVSDATTTPSALRIVTEANRFDTVDDGVTWASISPAGTSTVNTSTASLAPTKPGVSPVPASGVAVEVVSP